MSNHESENIKVRLVGGLGNQLFCYFAGYYLARKNNANLVLDITDIARRHSVNNSIKAFDLPGQFITSRTRNLSKFIYRVKSRILKRFLSRKSFYSNVVGYDSNLEYLNTGISLNGYFQSFRYYVESGKNFQNMKLVSPSSGFLQLKTRIESFPSVAIHVRRGDYINLADEYGLLGEGYYKEAISRIKKIHDDVKFYVFSDDVPLAKQTLGELVPSSTWWESSELSSAESLILMSLCRSIVIANSTFSWWGAMLGNPKTVIAPNKWFKNLDDPLYLYPPEWIKVESRWNP